MKQVNLIYGVDVIEGLKTLESESVQCVVTSPPYWGLRSYGTEKWEGGDTNCDHVANPKATKVFGNPEFNENRPSREETKTAGYYKDICPKCNAIRIDKQLGLEKTTEEYVSKMVEVFREVKRVLRKDGTLWLNLGDSYAVGKQGRDDSGGNGRFGGPRIEPKERKAPKGLKPKDLVGIPWRVAFALQADGWVLRSEIIWSKKNPMPESVTDRPTKSHEQIFLFSKAKWVGEPQRRFGFISYEDAKWLALFLDTEGNICAKRAKASSGNDHFGAQICFANTSKELVEYAKSIVGKGTVLERPGKNANMFYYQLSGREASDLLYRLYPFLIVKKRQAQLAIYFQFVIANGDQERRTKKGRLRGRLRDDDYTEELIKIWATMKQLNHFCNPDLSWVKPVKYGHLEPEKYFYDSEAIKEPHTTNENRPDGIVRDRIYDYDSKQKQLGRSQNPSGGHSSLELSGRGDFYPDGGRNKRTVWEIATQPYSEAHFATFPEEIPRICISAGTSEEGCCGKCGKPMERVVKKIPSTMNIRVRDAKKGILSKKSGFYRTDNDIASATERENYGKEEMGASETLGWQPTCKCNAETVPCLVLDPFSGSGTTGEVAVKLGRRYVGIDLNKKYEELAKQRIGLFACV